MSISDLGSLGEFVASIAVFASVIYLAMQIRAQEGEQKQRAAAALAHAWSDAGRPIAENAEVAEIFARGIDDYNALRDTEKLRFGAIMTGMLKAYEAIYYLREEGALEEEAWLTTADMVGRLCRASGFNGYWAGRDTMFRPAFRDELIGAQRSDSPSKITDLYARSTKASTAASD